MQQLLINLTLSIVFLPLLAAICAGLGGNLFNRQWTHRICVSSIGLAFFCACYLCWIFLIKGAPSLEYSFYTWATAGMLKFDVAFLVDRLSVLMIMIVLFISWMVHIYTIGYMADDPGYQRFFSYVSLFTFAMLILVLANNFLLLFFGWEGVGLVSYLLIGFWFKREGAALGSLKAFIVNRVGDVGFILAIAAILMYCGTLDYQAIFFQAPSLVNTPFPGLFNVSVSVVTIICFLLFIGAMAKSAQIPLHVWLPESMEGPTPISALIHAATMVTAGIYMVARLSPLFEYAPPVLSFITVIGGTTAFFLGLIALTQNDIKRVIAYSTISQLGYMAVALGVSAYDAAIFHLVTHAFFKALLFLAAGSVIISMHHEQDMRKMGGLASYLPTTYVTFVVGALALCAIPPFSGFYSKDTIIEAAHLSTIPGAHYAYWCVLAGAFITSLYTFRALLLTFHTQERWDPHLRGHIKESSWVILLPLAILVIPSIFAGQWLIGAFLYAQPKLLGDSIFVLPQHDGLQQLSLHYPGAMMMALQAGSSPTFWLALGGIVVAWLFVAVYPTWTSVLKRRFKWIYTILIHKYGFDAFNKKVIVQGTQEAGHLFYDLSDVKIIDGVGVNGSASAIRWFSATMRKLQTGYLYHYAFVMILGVVGFLIWYLGGF